MGLRPLLPPDRGPASACFNPSSCVLTVNKQTELIHHLLSARGDFFPNVGIRAEDKSVDFDGTSTAAFERVIPNAFL